MSDKSQTQQQELVRLAERLKALNQETAELWAVTQQMLRPAGASEPGQNEVTPELPKSDKLFVEGTIGSYICRALWSSPPRTASELAAHLRGKHPELCRAYEVKALRAMVGTTLREHATRHRPLFSEQPNPADAKNPLWRCVARARIQTPFWYLAYQLLLNVRAPLDCREIFVRVKPNYQDVLTEAELFSLSRSAYAALKVKSEENSRRLGGHALFQRDEYARWRAIASTRLQFASDADLLLYYIVRPGRRSN